MTLPRYPEYQDSGVEWLGEIPAHWGLLPHRAIFHEVIERGFPDAEMLSVTISKGVILQSQLLANSSKKDSSNIDKSNYKLVSVGDIAYNKMRAWQGAIGASKYRGIISPAYIIVRLRDTNNSMYYHYLFRTPAFHTEAERWSYGITSDQWSLRYDEFKQIYSPIPPPDEQAEIVRFLDAAETLIRRYIRAKQKLIKLLNEQKQAIIQHAVTQGLDPDAPMKDSGIEWLGEIPSHWEMRKLKHVVPDITVGIVIQPAQLYVSSGVPCLRSLNISSGRVTTDKLVFISEESNRNNKKSQIFAGDIIVVRTGRAGVSVIVPTEFDGANCVDLLIIRQSEIVLSEYLKMYLDSHAAKIDVEYHSVGAIQAHYNTNTLANLFFPVPPIQEQKAILKKLDSELSWFNHTIDKVSNEIELMQEYRTRLIADVVTGKIDVRGLAFALPDTFREDDLLGEDFEDDPLLDDEDLEEA